MPDQQEAADRPADDAERADATDATESPDETGAPSSTEQSTEPATEQSTQQFTELPTGGPRRVTGLRVGYRADEVDAFVTKLRAAVDHQPPDMAPYEVADARFKASRVRRRYQMRSVDELLEVGQQVLRHRHGDDAVAQVEGHLAPPRHVPTLWIYLVALVLVAAMIAFLVLTQL